LNLDMEKLGNMYVSGTCVRMDLGMADKNFGMSCHKKEESR